MVLKPHYSTIAQSYNHKYVKQKKDRVSLFLCRMLEIDQRSIRVSKCRKSVVLTLVLFKVWTFCAQVGSLQRWKNRLLHYHSKADQKCYSGNQKKHYLMRHLGNGVSRALAAGGCLPMLQLRHYITWPGVSWIFWRELPVLMEHVFYWASYCTTMYHELDSQGQYN